MLRWYLKLRHMYNQSLVHNKAVSRRYFAHVLYPREKDLWNYPEAGHIVLYQEEKMDVITDSLLCW